LLPRYRRTFACLEKGTKLTEGMQCTFACVVDVFDSGIRVRKFSAIDPTLAKIGN